MVGEEANEDAEENGTAVKVEKGTKLRCKLIGTRVDATEIVSPSSFETIMPCVLYSKPPQIIFPCKLDTLPHNPETIFSSPLEV